MAGPVVAAAVILPFDFDIRGLADSKKLTPHQRDIQRARIEDSNSLWAIGVVGHDIVDKINILRASLLAMKMAVEKLSPQPDIVYVDGKFKIPDINIQQETFIRGEDCQPTIAAASILAKTYRDDIMVDLDLNYPGYGFGQHKGYPTKEHIGNLNRLGPSPIHRLSFHPVCELIENGKYSN